MTTKHHLTEAEALAIVENDATEWTEIPDVDDAGSIREQVRRLEAAAARLDEVVLRARRNGLTWLEIGRSLGVSHQAARKKYAHRV